MMEMDCFMECVVLGLDSIVLAACIRQYYQRKNAISSILNAPALPIDKNLKDYVKSQPESKVPYITLRGTVKPIGNILISNNNPLITGVIQNLRIREHVVQRTSTGFWSDSERTIQEVHNVVPFGLESKGVIVEMAEPLTAEYLEMEVISDTFNPTIPSVIDHLWGFFSGVRQRGVQSTEKMLRTGTVVTAVGELVYEKDGMIRLQRPSNGSPYYLTPMQIPSLVKKVEASKRNYAMLIMVSAAVGIVVVGMIARKYLKRKRERKEEQERRLRIAETRRNRRRENRDSNELDNNDRICVVCRTNPIEMIVLPCGHVCLCEDCAENITANCPICRAEIQSKALAYVV
ncbi:LOW QUALITY PROTEIN: mitochondrial E3 ubiquitin protein ligase 1-like [Anthonomus grandis grandis]|uniref:LOW QUALITY PROTEIN: mitochondrial E3 ubiquitin protein ligase 1-like n=1 Tax=Anthonomus grandis grandis TaxID=2921223 RepID=UPI002165F7F5|nr:LOW QUALITY PROTEIN: mitochondrial E3 ubiquitin protein ligase 1-like [Anthonomus grandis grandis]